MAEMKGGGKKTSAWFPVGVVQVGRGCVQTAALASLCSCVVVGLSGPHDQIVGWDILLKRTTPFEDRKTTFQKAFSVNLIC